MGKPDPRPPQYGLILRGSHHRPLGRDSPWRGYGPGRNLSGRRFNRPDFNIMDHYTYALSPTATWEGVASEAASLAGTLGLAS